jgi:ketosteroid isomerase-like protein
MLEADARREANFDLYRRMLTAQNAKDKAAFLGTLAEDILFEAPAYTKNGAPIASGRAAMSGMFDPLSQMFSVLNYQLLRFIPAVDPDLVLAEVRGDNHVAGGDKRYRNQYLFLVTCRDGKIPRIFEYSNPVIFAEATGASG